MLHDRQEDFISIPDTVFEGLYGGAAYGGKSFLITLYPLLRGFYQKTGFKGIILRRKFPDLEREIIRLSREYYPATGATYNETKHVWTWPWGAYMDFGHCQHENDIKSYDSAQYNYCAFDELTHFTQGMYTYMVGSRVRPSNDFNVAIVRNGTNPGGIGQTFVYNRFVKPCEDGYRIIIDKNTGLRRFYIPCLPQDNPYGMQYDPDYLQKLEILSEADKRAKKFGDWHAFEGSVFPEFRPWHFSGEPDNACHSCSYFDIPEWWPRILSIDWGKRAMCHALWSAIAPDNRVYIYRERAWKGVDIPYWATEVGELSARENIIHFTLCQSGFQDRGSETIALQVERYSQMRPYSSENTPGSRVQGLNLIHDFLRWEEIKHSPKEEKYDESYANEIYRKFGSVAKDRYLSQFSSKQQDKNIPRLQILCRNFDPAKPAVDSVAPILLETLPQCVYDEKRTEDIAEFDGDDPIDNLRYNLKTINQYCNGELGEELERRKQIQEITERLAITKDYTSFYRDMEAHEFSESETFGVRRGGSRRR